MLFVTIGPQCAGKTTYLSSFGCVTDVSIDDMTGTYEKVQFDEIVSYNETGILTESLCRRVCRKSLFEYINDASAEQLPIVLYFAEVWLIDCICRVVICFSVYSK